ncbi:MULTISPECIES: citrate synthase [Isoptericola]|uniref:Citrate synthase n=1 Tax=Isoptericola sediminis TaxID=2733572 RepID=A0A849JY82_9MICO|nr:MULTISPECIES: citrate synthase [Isoptericola]MDO8144319.1 citrate synthase [Isoptericola sp. 178]MDO8148173.1 citrate synthase [Isoptericola sp. b515]MDO8151650.1 citrate synthase [Isoptericola sp. b408]NNU28266.1 citrate synthase [Isoptericola sediminis]
MTSTQQTATVELSVDGTRRELPVVAATEGNDGIVVSSLLKDTGMVTVDPGFTNTASCESAITYIDGGQGILRYRGYPIEQLADSSSFLEVSYLLIHGELPSPAQLEAFTDRINRHTLVPEAFRTFLGTFPRGGHPMAIMASAVNALATYYPESLDPHDDEAVELATVLILAKIRTITSYVHRSMRDEPLLYPDAARGYVDDFLRMTFARPYEEWQANPTLVAAMDKLLILHADHEQNCSTSTVRVVGSSNATLYASVSAGINALSGPSHGGANEAVLLMLENIRSGEDSVETFMKKVKNKEDGVRLMGFGHRVYKSYDPRAAIVKKHADAVLDELGAKDELLDIARGLEEIALNDDYFVERKLYPNVDFYTGLIYKAMGFSPAMFTPLFALGRMPGWIAQWREMMKDPQTKIGRPRQIYTGPTERPYVPLDQR